LPGSLVVGDSTKESPRDMLSVSANATATTITSAGYAGANTITATASVCEQEVQMGCRSRTRNDSKTMTIAARLLQPINQPSKPLPQRSEKLLAASAAVKVIIRVANLALYLDRQTGLISRMRINKE